MTNHSRLHDAVNHPGCSITAIAGPCSPNVFINGIRAAIKGDATFPHCPIPHIGHCVGTRNVYINGKDSQGIGDPVDCGAVIVGGSPNVFIP